MDTGTVVQWYSGISSSEERAEVEMDMILRRMTRIR